MGSFTNNNLTERGTNQDFGYVVAYKRWSLREVPHCYQALHQNVVHKTVN